MPMNKPENFNSVEEWLEHHKKQRKLAKTKKRHLKTKLKNKRKQGRR